MWLVSTCQAPITHPTTKFIQNSITTNHIVPEGHNGLAMSSHMCVVLLIEKDEEHHSHGFLDAWFVCGMFVFNLICRSSRVCLVLSTMSCFTTHRLCLSFPAAFSCLRPVSCNTSQEVQKFLTLLHSCLQLVRSSIRGLLLPQLAQKRPSSIPSTATISSLTPCAI